MKMLKYNIQYTIAMDSITITKPYTIYNEYNNNEYNDDEFENNNNNNVIQYQ
jgi:hypothetical protein